MENDDTKIQNSVSLSQDVSTTSAAEEYNQDDSAEGDSSLPQGSGGEEESSLQQGSSDKEDQSTVEENTGNKSCV